MRGSTLLFIFILEDWVRVMFSLGLPLTSTVYYSLLSPVVTPMVNYPFTSLTDATSPMQSKSEMK